MPTKKTTPKKTTAKKAAPKKTTARKAPSKKAAPKSAMQQAFPKPTANEVNGLLVGIIVFLVGALFSSTWYFLNASTTTKNLNESGKIFRYNGNTFVSVKNISDEFKVEAAKGNDIIVSNGKTWIAVKGKPTELIIVNDKECGSACNPQAGLAVLRQNVTPALITRIVDVSSDEGKQYIDDFDIVQIPAYILGDGADEVVTENGQKFVEVAAQIFDKKDGKYFFNASANLPKGKFIKEPEIDTKDEPQIGKGPITVVEFTDFQCPYCKRLHDQNKALIQGYIDDGTITYVVKDYPLGFHKKSIPMDIGMNCIKQEGGDEEYFAIRDQVFKDQGVWSKMTDENLNEYIVGLANDQDVDISGCIVDDAETIKAEALADQKEGSKYGVTGTPALFIGSQFVPGAIGPDKFKAAIEGEK